MTHKENNQSFFYTFGTSDSFPYKKGWVEVQAPNRGEADKLFRSRFPDRTAGILNCAFVYDQVSFDAMLACTEMPSEWKTCHEVIASEQFARSAFDKPFWAEIRNDYFTDDFSHEKDGAIRASISIDAWKTHDDNEEGKVIAKVILSEHGDILVDYHDNVARWDAAAQESIQDAIRQMQEYVKEQGIDLHEQEAEVGSLKEQVQNAQERAFTQQQGKEPHKKEVKDR